jgi:hypothetical protein
LEAPSGKPALTIWLDSVDLPTTDLPWSAFLTFTAHGAHAVAITGVTLVSASTPAPVSPSAGNNESGTTDTKNWVPFQKSLARGGEWDGFIFGHNHLYGAYEALVVDFTIDGQPGTYSFPALARAYGDFH